VPQPFYEVLYHPVHFSTTVENVFDVTFLIKRGHASLTIDPETQMPMICRVNADASMSPAGAEQGATNYQFIHRLVMSEWAAIVQALGIKKAFLPERAQAAQSKATPTNSGRKARGAAAAAAASSSANDNGAARAPSAAPAASSARKRGRPVASISRRDNIGAFISSSQPTLLDSLVDQRAKKRTRTSAGGTIREENEDEVGDEDEDDEQ
jgi:hypothetical protein